MDLFLCQGVFFLIFCLTCHKVLVRFNKNPRHMQCRGFYEQQGVQNFSALT